MTSLYLMLWVTIGNLHLITGTTLTHEFPCYHGGICQHSAPTQFQSVLTQFYKSSSHSDSQYQPLEVHLIPLNYRWQERKLLSGLLSHPLFLSLHCFSLSPGFQWGSNPHLKRRSKLKQRGFGLACYRRRPVTLLLTALSRSGNRAPEQGARKETLGTKTEQLGRFVSHRSVEDWFRLLSKLLELIETSVSSVGWHHECWNCESRLWLLRLVRKCIAHQTSCRVSTLNLCFMNVSLW